MTSTTMPKEHLVRTGECLNSIAAKHGFRSLGPIRDMPENADLWARREHNFNVLFPGDVVFIPDFEQGSETRPTGTRHTFVARGPFKTWFQCRVRVAGAHHYELSVDGGEVIAGTVDGDEQIRHLIAADATTGKLQLWPVRPAAGDAPQSATTKPADSEILTWQLRFGDLDPLTETRGVQQRLRNLGFDPGPTLGVTTQETRDAIRTFQRGMDLPVTGNVDDVRDPLREAYGE